jgi:DNA-binding response OmpR family regulator
MSAQKTILLIDDEINLQTMVKITLQTKQYNVVLANNGLEGLEQLKTVKPDLIILDMNMPKMGGVEFYQKICDKNGRPQYPVLVLTARANMEQLFKQFNIDGFMAKPFEIDQLLNEVDTIIKKRSASGEKISAAGKLETRKVCIIEMTAK